MAERPTPPPDALGQLRELVEKKLRTKRGPKARRLNAHDYARLWESLGHSAQLVCDTGDSWGMYYTVYALYEADPIFATQPLALIFSDFSKTAEVTWAFPRGEL